MLAYEEAQRLRSKADEYRDERDRMEGERDRAREVAVALEQECDRLTTVLATLAFAAPTDAQPSPGSSSDPGSEGPQTSVGPAGAHTGHPLPAVSPDCFVRKHDACTGEAWDSAADALVGCDCGCHEAAS